MVWLIAKVRDRLFFVVINAGTLSKQIGMKGEEESLVDMLFISKRPACRRYAPIPLAEHGCSIKSR